MTQTLTTEQLNDMADGNWPDSGFYDTIKVMARELLANRDAKPVAYLKKSIIDSDRFDSADPEIILHPNTPEGWLSEYQAVFTAPPAPAVPEEKSVCKGGFCSKHTDTALIAHPYIMLTSLPPKPKMYCPECEPGVADWGSCRAAVPAQPVSQGCTLNSPETPDGWVACSERMPPVNDVVITSNNDSVSACLSEASAKYRYFTSIVSGREVDVTHWMPLPAAPEGGNDA